jgi:hypothetical protein
VSLEHFSTKQMDTQDDDLNASLPSANRGLNNLSEECRDCGRKECGEGYILCPVCLKKLLCPHANYERRCRESGDVPCTRGVYCDETHTEVCATCGETWCDSPMIRTGL